FADGKTAAPVGGEDKTGMGEEDDRPRAPIGHSIVGPEQPTQAVLTQIRRKGLVGNLNQQGVPDRLLKLGQKLQGSEILNGTPEIRVRQELGVGTSNCRPS